MFKNAGIGAKLFMAFGLIVVVIVIITSASVFMTRHIVEDYSYILKEQIPVADAAMESNIIMMDIMYDTVKYADTGDNVYMQDIAESKEMFRELEAKVKNEMQANKVVVQEIENQLFEKLRKLIEMSDKITSAYGSAEFKKISRETMADMQAVHDSLEESAEKMEKDTEAVTDENIKDADRTYEGLLAIMIISGISVALLAAVLGWFITRSITVPVTNVVSALNSGAAQVTSASEQVASASQELAQGASEQASSLEETSSSLEEMASMINMNADNARQANALSDEANTVTKDGLKAMENMTKSVERIKISSDQTAKIIKTIDEIAFQTNLLALNAAVEAARAGDAGKGFAVVAEEVRNLAKRAAEAAKSTNDLIADVQKNVESGVGASNEMVEMLKKISEKVNKVAGLSNEVAAASQEQSKGIAQITAAVSEMDKVTQGTSASAEESASASEEMSSQAIEMKEMVEKLKTVVYGESISVIKAAEKPAKTSGHITHKKAAGAPALKKAVAAAPQKLKPQQIIPLDASDVREFSKGGM